MKVMSKTIFMIHGMWVGPWCWENYKEFFEARGYRCITPLLRFHDADPTDKPDPELGKTSVLDYAHDLEEELKQLDAPPVLMGHSMGGLLAQMLASRGLGKLAILIAPALPHGLVCVRLSMFRSILSAFALPGLWRRPYKLRFKEAAYAFLHLMAPEEQRNIYERLCHESGRALCEIGLWPLDTRKATRVDEANVRCPVLVLAGSQDRIIPAACVRRVAEKYRSVSRYREYEAHAHLILGEPGWEKVAEDIAAWLEQNTDTDPSI